jgi:hypothetical protein
VGIGAISGTGTSDVWLPLALSFAIIVKPAGSAREFLNSSAIFSSVSVEGILIVVPRTGSRSLRTGSGAGAMEPELVVEIVFDAGAEGLGGGRGAEEGLLEGRLFDVSVMVFEGSSGGT